VHLHHRKSYQRVLKTEPKTPRVTSSDDVNAAIERVAPNMLALLGDGVPRAEAAIVAALADRHPKDEVKLTVMRLDVVGRLDLQGGRGGAGLSRGR
jgi:hypothetical protein